MLRVDLLRRHPRVPRVRADALDLPQHGPHAARLDLRRGARGSPRLRRHGGAPLRDEVQRRHHPGEGGGAAADLGRPLGSRGGSRDRCILRRGRRAAERHHDRHRRHVDRHLPDRQGHSAHAHRGPNRRLRHQDAHDRHAHGRGRRGFDRVARGRPQPAGRAPERGRRARPGLLRDRRHRADPHRRAHRARKGVALPAGRRDKAGRRGRSRGDRGADRRARSA